jgi:flagellar biosynthesis/type III secretory pathway protein FliH
LRHAAKIDTDAIPAALQQPLLLRAVEELKVLTQTDIERERYEARRKGQLDYETGLKAARLEGREEGREEGQAEARKAFIRMVHRSEQLLNRPETPADELARLSLADLSRLAEELQSQPRPHE